MYMYIYIYILIHTHTHTPHTHAHTHTAAAEADVGRDFQVEGVEGGGGRGWRRKRLTSSHVPAAQ
jgi:hypothetical protein